MPENIWNCQMSRKSTDDFQTSLSQLTVGEKFYLQCRFIPNNILRAEDVFQEFPSIDSKHPLDEQLAFFLGDQQWAGYALKPLKVISASNDILLLEVTSYLPGHHNANQGLFFKIKNHAFSIENLSWQVDSSFTSQQGATTQTMQPHPSYGFVKIPLPYMDIVFWGGIFLSGLICLFFIMKKIQKRKKEFNDIKNLKSLRDPIYDFYYKAKTLEKKYLISSINKKTQDPRKKPSLQTQQLQLFSKGLNQIFRRFLAVQLNFPAHIWSSKKSYAYLKKTHFSSQLLDRMRRMLYELDQMQITTNPLSEEECYRNLLLCKNLVNQIVDFKKRKQT